MKKLSVLLLLLLLLNVVLPCFAEVKCNSTISALATVWSDDFDDGNIDDWETMGVNWTNPAEPADVPANFTLVDGSLRATGDYDSQASHASTVTTGTWSFDVDCVDTARHHFYIAFMRDGLMTNVSSPIPAAYGLMIVTDVFGSFDDEIVLYRRNAGSPELSALLDLYSIPGISSWCHFDITGDSE